MEYLLVKIVYNKYNTDQSLKNICRYCITDKSIKGSIDTNQLVQYWGTGRVLKNIDSICEEMIFTQKYYGKNSKRRIYQIIVSFPVDFTDKLLIDKIAKYLTHHFFVAYEVIYGIHDNTKHLHIHFAVNAVSYLTGKKWHMSKKEMIAWRGSMCNQINQFLKSEGKGALKVKYLGDQE